jgi:uncharacterized protein (DUF1499 family)
MTILKIIPMVAAALIVLALVSGQLGLLSGTQPNNLGVHEGKLSPPAMSPNSISSQADLYPDHPQRKAAAIAPISYTGSQVLAMDKLLQTLKTTPGVKVITAEPDYVYAQASTQLMKFTDDLEFWFDAKQSLIHLRSASRLGYSDLGANRARIEDIRARFNR